MVGLLFLGCDPTKYINLSSDRYTPRFQQDLSFYSGRSIYLMDIQDEDDQHFGDHFGGHEYKTWYIVAEGYYPNFPSYFWYAFDKALRTVSMKVSDSGDPDLSAPQLQLTILRLTEASYRFSVQLSQYGRTLLTKVYEVQLPVLRSEQRTEPALEQRIDRMIDELIQAVLTDPEFKRAFLESEGPSDDVRR